MKSYKQMLEAMEPEATSADSGFAKAQAASEARAAADRRKKAVNSTAKARGVDVNIANEIVRAADNA